MTPQQEPRWNWKENILPNVVICGLILVLAAIMLNNTDYCVGLPAFQNFVFNTTANFWLGLVALILVLSVFGGPLRPYFLKGAALFLLAPFGMALLSGVLHSILCR